MPIDPFVAKINNSSLRKKKSSAHPYRSVIHINIPILTYTTRQVSFVSYFPIPCFVCSKLWRLCNWKKQNCIQIEIKRIVRNEPLALCSDKRCNYVATFASWWFSMKFNVRFAFLTYRRCVSFAAFISFHKRFILREHVCVCARLRWWGRKQKRKYKWVRISYELSSMVLNDKTKIE